MFYSQQFRCSNGEADLIAYSFLTPKMNLFSTSVVVWQDTYLVCSNMLWEMKYEIHMCNSDYTVLCERQRHKLKTELIIIHDPSK